MNTCASLESHWTALLAEDAPISPELEAHLEGCPACRRLLETHRGWECLLMEEPDAAAFTNMRSAVLARVRNRFAQAKTRSAGHRDVTGRAWKWGAVTALAATLLIAGFLIGRGGSFAPEIVGANLLRQVRHQASVNTRFEDSASSPYSYSNISLSPLVDGRIALSFDLSTHMEVAGEKDDPLVKDVLAQALLNPESINSRLKAIGIAHEVMDPKIKQALILAMKHDDSLPVRLKAMSLLSSYKENAAVAEAFLSILKEDESVQLRLQALEYLAGNPSRRNALRDALNQLSKPEDTPLLLKANIQEIH